MLSGDPGTARQEAERLVVAALAAATLAANAYPDIATGSAACCVCPFCKIIDAVRDPDPEFVERLATGAGDLAVGIAGLMRNLAGPRDAAREPHDVWRTATAAPGEAPADPFGGPAGGAPPTKDGAPPKKMAKKALKKATPADPSMTVSTDPDQAQKAVPKKAVRKVAPPSSE